MSKDTLWCDQQAKQSTANSMHIVAVATQHEQDKEKQNTGWENYSSVLGFKKRLKF